VGISLNRTALHFGGLTQQSRLAYQTVGRVDEAIRLLKRTVTDRERVLGEDHPRTLSSSLVMIVPPAHAPGLPSRWWVQSVSGMPGGRFIRDLAYSFRGQVGGRS
jgi:Tetratricopeptide repeat